jgi:hypothetical protein
VHTVSDWQPVETCPEKTDVIVFVPTAERGRRKLVGSWAWTMNKASKLWIIDGHMGFDIGKVTHWMELPDDPE